jgi:hypothetical protein
MIATGRALQVEVVVTPVLGGIDVAQEAVGPVRIDKPRVLAEAVCIREHRALPGRERRPGLALPKGNLPSPGRIQEVIVAGKTGLAVGVHGDVIARLHPKDVVAKGRSMGGQPALQSHRVTHLLVHRVVDDICAKVWGDEDPSRRVSIHEVVCDLEGGDTVPGGRLDAGRVRVHDVAACGSTVQPDISQPFLASKV